MKCAPASCSIALAPRAPSSGACRRPKLPHHPCRLPACLSVRLVCCSVSVGPSVAACPRKRAPRHVTLVPAHMRPTGPVCRLRACVPAFVPACLMTRDPVCTTHPPTTHAPATHPPLSRGNQPSCQICLSMVAFSQARQGRRELGPARHGQIQPASGQESVFRGAARGAQGPGRALGRFCQD